MYEYTLPKPTLKTAAEAKLSDHIDNQKHNMENSKYCEFWNKFRHWFQKTPYSVKISKKMKSRKVYGIMEVWGVSYGVQVFENP